MLQAALSDFLLPFSENCFVASEVGVCGCDVFQALGVALVIVVIDDGPNLAFEIARQVGVFQQNTVIHRHMPTLDLTLGLWMEWRTADMLHVLPFHPFSQIGGDVTGSVVTQQAGFMAHDSLITARSGQCQLKGFGHILSKVGQ